MTLRSPICVVVGHVDHGKSTLLDSIRGSAITTTEAGKITQAIGASIIPLSTIKSICGDLVKTMSLTIPGLLFVDTPGHAAFSSLRKRGGSIADIAILVVDINEGFKPQTIESVKILKQTKTPFIVAANKIDLLAGWKQRNVSLLSSIAQQSSATLQTFENKMYELVGSLYELGFPTERFDRVNDYAQQVGIVPVSAMTKEGYPELLMVLTGLTQKFLEKNLHSTLEGPAKGTILEVKEEKGLGTTIDVILYDGTLHVNDTVVIGTLDDPIVTTVRALLEPKPLMEMRDKRTKYSHMQNVVASTGVKLCAPDLDRAIAGMPLRGATTKSLSSVKKEVKNYIQEVMLDTDDEGLIIKADTLGGIEALARLLRDHKIPVLKAGIGPISKKDVSEAESNCEKNPFFAVVMGFNVAAEVTSPQVKIFTHPVIYQLIDEYEAWKKALTEKMEQRGLSDIVRPSKCKLMTGYVFRQCNPAVSGTEILSGTIRTGMGVMNSEGKVVGTIKGIQENKENITEAQQNTQVAVSYETMVIGRSVFEGDILYSDIPEPDFKKLKELKGLLSKAELQIMKEIANIKRKDNPVWGV